MTSAGLFALFLFLHVLAAIVAFGPALSFGLIGAFGGREPQHANFSVRLAEMLSKRVVIPVGLTLPVTGVGMIWVAQIDLAARQNWWLGVAIVIYTIAMGYAIFVQAPTVERLIHLTAGGPPPAGSPMSAPGPGAARADPPPHIAAALRRVQFGGIFLSTSIVLIVALMVIKPQV